MPIVYVSQSAGMANFMCKHTGSRELLYNYAESVLKAKLAIEHLWHKIHVQAAPGIKNGAKRNDLVDVRAVNLRQEGVIRIHA